MEDKLTANDISIICSPEGTEYLKKINERLDEMKNGTKFKECEFCKFNGVDWSPCFTCHEADKFEINGTMHIIHVYIKSDGKDEHGQEKWKSAQMTVFGHVQYIETGRRRKFSDAVCAHQTLINNGWKWVRVIQIVG